MKNHPYFCTFPATGETSLLRALPIAPVSALVGAGGKTHTMFALARELSEAGQRVIVTTTTHIMRPSHILPENVRVVGTPLPDGRLGSVPDPDALKAECDYLLIEADGSRCHPCKVPADHEPVLTAGTQTVIAVLGLSSIGGQLKEVCHRSHLAGALLGKSPEAVFTAQDAVMLLKSESGQRKNVFNRTYAVVLNQADTPERCRLAMEIGAQLGDIPWVMTSHKEGLL